MKKIIVLVMAALLLLSMTACGKNEAEAPAPMETPEPTVEPTPEPTPVVPEWEPGIARANYGELLYLTLDKGEVATVIGELKDYYIIEGEELDLIIEKRFMRFKSEGEYESWTGYAKYGALAFDNVYRRGEPILQLHLNQTVTVTEGKGDWLFVEWDGGSGYVREEDISRHYIDTSGGGGGDGGGGGAGGDINLDLVAYYGPEMEELNEAAEILADGVEAYICLTLRDDELKVTSYDKEKAEIYLEGFTATAPRWLLRMEGDEEYEPWTAYARTGAVVYEEYQMRNVLMELKVNDEVLVIDKLPDCYVVEINGQIGYVLQDDLSETVIVYYGGDGGGGGGDGVWTPPVV